MFASPPPARGGRASGGTVGQRVERPVETILAEIAAAGTGPVPDIGEAGLALARLDRPQVSADWYLAHLNDLARGAQRLADIDPGQGLARLGAEASAVAGCLSRLLAADFGYQGDSRQYDSLENANLMRVIDRRRGLPVALCILYMAVGRRAGWRMDGVGFPGHFLVRVSVDGSRAIIDPFHGGGLCRPADLRRLLKAVMGAGAELTRNHYEPVPDRDVLIRLQNNIKSRLMAKGDLQGAARVVATMRRMAPDDPSLLFEDGVLSAEVGRLHDAMAAMTRLMDPALGADPRLLNQAAVMLQTLRGRMN